MIKKNSRSLSNEPGPDDGNENGKKGLIIKARTLHGHHAFLYIYFTSLHDKDMKVVPNFTFCEGRGHKQGLFFFSQGAGF